MLLSYYQYGPFLTFHGVHYEIIYHIIILVIRIEQQYSMRYRSRTDIISEILDAANGNNASKTKLMYKAFLSFVQMKEYLTILTESGLLRYDSNTHTFKTTEKGLRFLEAYNELDGMIKESSSSLRQ